MADLELRVTHLRVSPGEASDPCGLYFYGGSPKVFSGMEKEGLVETMAIGELVDIMEIAARKREKGKQTGDIFKLKKEGLDKKEIAAKLGITEEIVFHRLEGL